MGGEHAPAATAMAGQLSTNPGAAGVTFRVLGYEKREKIFKICVHFIKHNSRARQAQATTTYVYLSLEGKFMVI